MEFWDIYDANKQPTGRTMKRNDLVLKRRGISSDGIGRSCKTGSYISDHKACDDKSLGSGLVGSFRGAAQAGEASYDAVLREVKEETGLDVSKADGGYLFTYKRENPGEGDNYFVDVYRFVLEIEDEDLNLQTEETDGYMFADLDKIKEIAAKGEFLHYDSIKEAFEF